MSNESVRQFNPNEHIQPWSLEEQCREDRAVEDALNGLLASYRSTHDQPNISFRLTDNPKDIGDLEFEELSAYDRAGYPGEVEGRALLENIFRGLGEKDRGPLRIVTLMQNGDNSTDLDIPQAVLAYFKANRHLDEQCAIAVREWVGEGCPDLSLFIFTKTFGAANMPIELRGVPTSMIKAVMSGLASAHSDGIVIESVLLPAMSHIVSTYIKPGLGLTTILDVADNKSNTPRVKMVVYAPHIAGGQMA